MQPKNMNDNTLIGPFKQLLTMNKLEPAGALSDNDLEIIVDGAIAISKDGFITAIGSFNRMQKDYHLFSPIHSPAVALPGLIDSHTHLCFAGSRAADYARRLSGVSYNEIAKQGGGILDTVTKTRLASEDDLTALLLKRSKKLLAQGITTCEVKSGYGLSVDDELKILKAIQKASLLQPVELIATCLAAHVLPPEFSDGKSYLKSIIAELFPLLLNHNLTKRIDIFVEENAFTVAEAREYLTAAKENGFAICLHADQFSRGGALLAAELSALSADHLEVSTTEDFKALAKANVIPIALPGASLGLGLPFPKARQMLDAGLPLVIASDWNPGSAPMGQLLLQAAVLGAAEHLSLAETLAAITVRAARALALNDRGYLAVGKRCDLAVFPCHDFREILYRQGSLHPCAVYTQGVLCHTSLL